MFSIAQVRPSSQVLNKEQTVSCVPRLRINRNLRWTLLLIQIFFFPQMGFTQSSSPSGKKDESTLQNSPSSSPQEPTKPSNLSPLPIPSPPSPVESSQAQSPSSFQSYSQKLITFIQDWGLKVSWTQGNIHLESTANSSTSAQSAFSSSLAQGDASLNGAGLSLFSRPKSGWQINPNFGVQFLESNLEDLIPNSTLQSRLAGRSIGTQCSWVDQNQKGSCRDATLYQIDLDMLYLGVWAGYISKPVIHPRWSFLKGIVSMGVIWNPLNLFWVTTTLNQKQMNDDLYFNWQGSLLAQLEFLVEWKSSGWILSLATHFGHLGTILYDAPLEFQGESYCDERGCSRYRSLTSETQLSMWNLCFSLIKTWGKD